MKAQVWVYIVVVVLSLGAGVAIAGLPSSARRDPTIVAPITTFATLAPATTESAPTGTDPVEEEDASAPSTTSTPTTSTTTPPTTTPPTTTTTTVPLVDRAEVGVAAVNGANVGGVATRASNALEALGYVDVGSFDGSEVVDRTAVYAAENFLGSAERLAVDAGIDAGRVFLLTAMPEVRGLDLTPVVLYLGRDSADLDLLR